MEPGIDFEAFFLDASPNNLGEVLFQPEAAHEPLRLHHGWSAHESRPLWP